MVAISGAIAAVLTAASFISAIIAEKWTRYLIIIVGTGISNLVGQQTGIYVLEWLVASFVSIFTLSFGLGPAPMPVYQGVSLVFIFALAYPLLEYAASFYQNN